MFLVVGKMSIENLKTKFNQLTLESEDHWDYRGNSKSERDYVHGWIYVPASKIKGVVQLVHGFGEHSRRYFHMIVGLMEAGFVVAADDHVGHGKTALENNTWGNGGHKGCQTMMEDEHLFKTIVQEKYPQLKK